MQNIIVQNVNSINHELCAQRRDFHRHPEQGWLEFRTASHVAEKLSQMGFTVQLGQEVVRDGARMGVPDEQTLKAALERARAQGAIERWLPALAGGFTGVVGILDTHRPGPIQAFRFDLDALPIQESKQSDHRPSSEKFASINEGSMHACGHDGHATIGLGLAELLTRFSSELRGRIKLIFQPAEEGVRGARSMVEAGVVDDVDYLIASHLGLGHPEGKVICGADGFLATSKLDARFMGKAAHAGGQPEAGRNALLAAAHSAIGLHSIASHSEGISRINVGQLNAGSGRNVIADSALLLLETRGATTTVNSYMESRAREVIEGAARMQDVDVSIDCVGSAEECASSPLLVEHIASCLASYPGIKHLVKHDTTPAGSEDATSLMARVITHGGQATYMIFGTHLAAGHHHPCFDFDESVLPLAVGSLTHIALTISASA
ncbi:amidohydrolase [Phytohalomonas tamaricis]|uniref:amidohydrolase n=1 Tax=Phytohalomonas tamaricis TaxID=2081032 RepID=UPI000D0B0912|nr:amidohydrolase [Phytohalomonas tamaricis]